MLQLIIGHTTTTTVKIWVRGTDAATTATVEITDGMAVLSSNPLPLLADDYRTAMVVFEGLEPDRRYACAVFFDDGTVARGACKTLPVRVDSFNFLLTSCNLTFGTESTSPEFDRIGKVAEAELSRFMIGCGDQIYIDTIFPGFGVKSRDDYRRRYEQTWASPEVAQVFATLPQYMIIDDHEIYNNFVNHNLDSRQQNLFDWAKSTYQLFQHAHNPDTVGVFYYDFSCSQADFFVMDLRTERTDTQMISETQFASLQQWLASGSTDRVKFIISSVPLFTQLISGLEKDKWADARYIRQRDRLIDVLIQSDHKKIIVLSGDIHLASHAQLTYDHNGVGHTIHELIASPIKQFQLPLLSHRPIPILTINGKTLAYSLRKHMGGPANEHGPRIPLVNNFMSITVADNTVHYKVFAASHDALLFEDTISL